MRVPASVCRPYDCSVCYVSHWYDCPSSSAFPRCISGVHHLGSGFFAYVTGFFLIFCFCFCFVFVLFFAGLGFFVVVFLLLLLFVLFFFF